MAQLKDNRMILTKTESIELFLILAKARLKLTGKEKTSAQKMWKRFEREIVLKGMQQ